ncbi:MAG: hypothetical protein NEA02_08480 [Thermoanaerobaculia bacterium]|nr:hypothetical protein [Thermoanaerobaculia bacterium]
MRDRSFSRDLAEEAEKFFRGSPEERLADALRVDPLALNLFLAGLPAGKSRVGTASVRRFIKQAQRPRPSRAKS